MSTDSFQKALIATLENEGGYTIIGGHETYYGIDRSWFPSWHGWKIVDDWKGGNIGEGKRDELLVEPVDSFYRANFWDRFQGDSVAEISDNVALELFDTAVNIGVSFAVRFLQTALNMQNQFGKTYPDIPVDGKLGRGTLNTLKRYLETQPGSRKGNEQILLNCMNGEQYIYYKGNAQHERFRGWFKRV